MFYRLGQIVAEKKSFTD